MREKAEDAEPHVSSSTHSPGMRPRSAHGFGCNRQTFGKSGPVDHPVAVRVDPSPRGRFVPAGVDHEVLDVRAGQAVGHGNDLVMMRAAPRGAPFIGHRVEVL